MPGVDVLATYRGCYDKPEDEIMRNVMTQKVKVKKLQFRWCNSTLCNGVNQCRHNYLFIFSLIFTFLAKLSF